MTDISDLDPKYKKAHILTDDMYFGHKKVSENTTLHAQNLSSEKCV